MKEEIKNLLDKLGWSVYEDEQGGVDLRKGSPAGEDFGFYVETENFIENVIIYARNFDPDEHATMWVENMHTVSGVPQSIRTLLDDADDIKEMLEDLADALKKLL